MPFGSSLYADSVLKGTGSEQLIHYSLARLAFLYEVILVPLPVERAGKVTGSAQEEVLRDPGKWNAHSPGQTGLKASRILAPPLYV